PDKNKLNVSSPTPWRNNKPNTSSPLLGKITGQAHHLAGLNTSYQINEIPMFARTMQMSTTAKKTTDNEPQNNKLKMSFSCVHGIMLCYKMYGYRQGSNFRKSAESPGIAHFYKYN
ncbi:hypothetical protein Tcan_00580, partial [Toxocara canis]